MPNDIPSKLLLNPPDIHGFFGSHMALAQPASGPSKGAESWPVISGDLQCLQGNRNVG